MRCESIDKYIAVRQVHRRLYYYETDAGARLFGSVPSAAFQAIVRKRPGNVALDARRQLATVLAHTRARAHITLVTESGS